MQVRSLPILGAEINGVNFSHPSVNDMLAIMMDKLSQHHLLIIRDQKLSEEQLFNTSKLFGEAVPSLVPAYRLENYPVITRHSNKKDEAKLPKGAVAPEYVFHADSYFTTNPNKFTLFYSLISPEKGGKTHFVDMCFAYDSLTESQKELIDGKYAIYKNAYVNQPPVMHPLVRTHPVTKRKALFVNIHRALGIEGMDHDQSMTLLENLYHHAINPAFVYGHKWYDGDLLIWDNRTTMHCATSITDNEERLLYRILTKGDLPVN